MSLPRQLTLERTYKRLLLASHVRGCHVPSTTISTLCDTQWGARGRLQRSGLPSFPDLGVVKLNHARCAAKRLVESSWQATAPL